MLRVNGFKTEDIRTNLEAHLEKHNLKLSLLGLGDTLSTELQKGYQVGGVRFTSILIILPWLVMCRSMHSGA